MCPCPSPLLRKRGKLPVKHKHVLSGYWGVLWKENYVMILTIQIFFEAKMNIL